MKKMYSIVYLNTALQKAGAWSTEAESEEEALALFHGRFRSFCQVLSINGRKV